MQRVATDRTLLPPRHHPPTHPSTHPFLRLQLAFDAARTAFALLVTVAPPPVPHAPSAAAPPTPAGGGGATIVRVAGVPTVPSTVAAAIMGAGASATAHATQLRDAVAAGRLIVVRAPSGPAAELHVGRAGGRSGRDGSGGGASGTVTAMVLRRDLIAWADAVAGAGKPRSEADARPAEEGESESPAAVAAAEWLGWALRQAKPESGAGVAGGAGPAAMTVTGREEVVDDEALQESIRTWLAERRLHAASSASTRRRADHGAAGSGGDSAAVETIVTQLLRMGVLMERSPGAAAGRSATTGGGGTAGGRPGSSAPTACGYWWGSPRSTLFWTYLAAGRAELVRRLRQCRYSEAALTTVLAWKLRKCPLSPQIIIWDALGAGCLAAVDAAAGRYLRVVAAPADTSATR